MGNLLEHEKHSPYAHISWKPFLNTWAFQLGVILFEPRIWEHCLSIGRTLFVLQLCFKNLVFHKIERFNNSLRVFEPWHWEPCLILEHYFVLLFCSNNSVWLARVFVQLGVEAFWDQSIRTLISHLSCNLRRCWSPGRKWTTTFTTRVFWEGR